MWIFNKNYFHSLIKINFGGYDTDDEECSCGGIFCSCCTCGNKLKMETNNNLRSSKWADVPLAWGLYFQDGASPSFEGIVDLHNRIMFYLVIILFGVSWIMLSLLWNFNKSHNKLVYRYLNHGTLIELVWTVGPALVLVAIAFPSFKLLYLMDEVIDPAMTVKITGLFFYIYKNFYKYLYSDGLKSYIFCINKLNFHTLVKTRNRIGPHDKDVISIIIGSLLGDSYGNKRFLEGTQFCFRQSSKHKEYLFWLYEFFQNRGYCSSLEPRVYIRKLKHKNVSKEYCWYEFNTFTFRSFDWIYKMFYKDGKKRIHFNISNFLTPLALAIWISDDGCWVKSGVGISCNAFKLNEVELLIEALKQNFGLLCNIKKTSNPNQYSIYIQNKSITKLREIVSPFMHNSMLYKLGI